MPMHEPHDDNPFEEVRSLARRSYRPDRSDDRNVEHRLINVERLARLYAIVRNPHHELAFGGLSTLELMRICAENLIRDRDYRAAARVLRHIERCEAERAGSRPT